MKNLLTILAVFVLSAIHLAAQTLANYEATIAAPLDGGGGPALWYTSYDTATVTGHMDNSGSAGIAYQAYRLGGQSYTDYFGNPTKAYGLVNPPTQAAAVAGSTALFMTGAQGTVCLLFKTPPDMSGLQVLFAQGPGFELAVNGGTMRVTYTSDGTKYANIGTPLAANTWYYAALKWDTSKPSNDLTWYVGEAGTGTLESGNLSIDAAGGNSSIVISGRTSANFFLSPIQEFAVWESELTDAAIQAQADALGTSGGGNQVEVSLEKSSDLQNWETADEGLYDVSDGSLFFRAVMTPR